MSDVSRKLVRGDLRRALTKQHGLREGMRTYRGQTGDDTFRHLEVTTKYTIPTTLQEVEAALDAGRLYGCANSNRAVWWKLRRNGLTRKWKTRPDDFRIPVKMGLSTCGQVTPDTIALFRIANSRADAAGGASIGTVGAGERDNA